VSDGVTHDPQRCPGVCKGARVASRRQPGRRSDSGVATCAGFR
jgi:hypothetical protein